MSAPRGAGGGDRLARLLNLVPYLLARPGIAVSEAAADLGVSDRQLREDLELLWVCGLPGYGPGDLIDMALDGDRLTLRYGDAERLAAQLVGYGSDARVLDPPEVRDFVVKRLHEIAAAHGRNHDRVG